MHVAKVRDCVADLVQTFDAERRDEFALVGARVLDGRAVEIGSEL